MGLTISGDNSTYGVKAVLKHRYGKKVFRECETLSDVRRIAGVKEREGCTVAMDGNVMMMQVPKGVRDLNGYVGIVFNAISAGMAAGKIVFVVFDEPDIITVAKAAEQAARDKKRGSGSTSPTHGEFPEDDDYGVEELLQVPDMHPLMRHRPARMRAFDEVMKRVLERCKSKLETWKHHGCGGAVLIDGVDPRGASRPIGYAREAQMVGTEEAMVKLFDHPAVNIGEGDIKLQHVSRTIREKVAEDHECAKGCALHLTVTIDTDSFAIELLDTARRQFDGIQGTQMRGILCMKERAKPNKRKRTMEEEEEDGQRSGYFTCVDIERLHELLQRDMWIISRNPPTAFGRRLAITFLCAGWALAGCDFCQVQGLRADVILDTIPGLMQRNPEMLARMQAAWEENRTNARNMVAALGLLLGKSASWMNGINCKIESIEKVREASSSKEEELFKAAWTVSYWNGIEYNTGLHEFGIYPLK